MRRVVLATTAALGLTVSSAAFAAGDAAKPPKQDWSFSGIFGTFDRAELQRGFQVYQEVCASCHSLRLIRYRNLADIGFNEDQIKAIAAEQEVTDGPDDEGEMFDRPAKPSDAFVSPFPNDNAARAANNGALPPDLSLIVKARIGGADYTHAVLTGYKEPPADMELGDGMSYNEYFGGNQIAMAPPLAEDQVEYADGTPATVDQMSRDVVTFLAWAAEPELEQRKNMGIKVLLFLILLTGLLYATKKKIWSDVH